MNNYIHKICLILLTIVSSCSEKKICEYDNPSNLCEPSFSTIEDFENYSLGSAGNWQQTALNSIEVVVKSGSKKMYFQDGSGGSNAYNTTDFPDNLTTTGCELVYDVEYDSGSFNGSTATNSISIYQGNFSTLTFTRRAIFVLKPPHLITSGAASKTIRVPILLATGSTLPSNEYGDWILVGASSIVTPVDITNFNSLITNIDGISIPIDNGANPVEKWWYDNFKFKRCCS